MATKKPGKKSDTAVKKLREQVKAEVYQELDDETGQLYNRFVAYISEARIPLYNALVVLDILKAEIVEQIRKKQGLV